MATTAEKEAYVLRRMQREPQTVLDVVKANTTGAEKIAIFAALVAMPPDEEKAQLVAARAKLLPAGGNVITAIDARLAEMGGAQ